MYVMHELVDCFTRCDILPWGHSDARQTFTDTCMAEFHTDISNWFCHCLSTAVFVHVPCHDDEEDTAFSVTVGGGEGPAFRAWWGHGASREQYLVCSFSFDGGLLTDVGSMLGQLWWCQPSTDPVPVFCELPGQTRLRLRKLVTRSVISTGPENTHTPHTPTDPRQIQLQATTTNLRRAAIPHSAPDLDDLPRRVCARDRIHLTWAQY